MGARKILLGRHEAPARNPLEMLSVTRHSYCVPMFSAAIGHKEMLQILTRRSDFGLLSPLSHAAACLGPEPGADSHIFSHRLVARSVRPRPPRRHPKPPLDTASIQPGTRTKPSRCLRNAALPSS